jgi:RNA polymerase sigma-70 factor, ECF subfamily
MDPSARKLALLVEEHYVLLYRYAYRLTGSEADALDLTQEAFLVAQSKWDQLRDDSRAKSWLFTIARNAFLKRLRDRGSQPVMIQQHDFFENLPGRASGGSSGSRAGGSAGDIDGEGLQQALNELPESFRTPLILYYFEEFSYKEIANQMEIPLGTVMSRLARAKEWLRRRLTSETIDCAAELLRSRP